MLKRTRTFKSKFVFTSSNIQGEKCLVANLKPCVKNMKSQFLESAYKTYIRVGCDTCDKALPVCARSVPQ